jgi:hypothetical protein
VNLSCANCRAIRPFSGQPPKCDVCGWVCGGPVKSTDTSFQQNLRKQRQFWREVGRTLFKAIVWGVVIVGGMIGVGYWLTPEVDRLAEQYHVSKDKIIIEPKPHGCDFDDAPLGNKHCHYEKAVDVERACPGPGCRVTAVYESWRKVEE